MTIKWQDIPKDLQIDILSRNGMRYGFTTHYFCGCWRSSKGKYITVYGWEIDTIDLCEEHLND